MKKNQLFYNIFSILVFMLIIFKPLTNSFAQNVFPLSIGGQDKFYVDTDGEDGIQSDSDDYMTMNRVKLEDAGDDTGKYAIILKGHKGLENENGFQQIFVIDGDVSGDGQMQIHESDVDVKYLDDDNNEVTVKSKWAHIGENGGPESYEGYVHSITFDMSDSKNQFSGYNNIKVKAENGTNLGDKTSESTISLGYNNEDYVDTIGFDNGGLAGNVLTNIGQNFKTAYVEKDGKKKSVSQEITTKHSTQGRKSFKFHIPLDDDGACNLSDGQSDGLYINVGMKLKREENPTPSQAPGTTGSLQVNILPLNAINSGAKWKVDDRNWQESGDIVYSLKKGEHTVIFQRLSGWRKPMDQKVSIIVEKKVTLTGTYRVAQGSGTLSAEISPQEANDAGAQWMLEEGEWKNTGEMMFNVSEGDYFIHFKKISGWLTPESIPLSLDNGNVKIVNGTYFLYGDADGNGKVNFSDLIIVQKIAVGLEVDLPELSIVDVVPDGTVGVRDSLRIFQYILGLTSSLEPSK
ncbi:conserved hypothetical protein, secreted [Candidatus Magnetomorum sp. HK-1]|nr:conserved hypothetical protein, secreted [Candidatus Magnetomorum sp. HK-1]